MTRLMGVPRVRPSNTPERICTLSCSWRGEVSSLCPGLRRSSSRWISAASSGSPGGQPSITAPMAGPCDSPQVVTRKYLPKVFIAF